MPQPPLNRLNKLEKTHARERRVFFIWKDPGDTPADVEAKRDRLIAEGTARADDESVGAAQTKSDVRLAQTTRHSGARGSAGKCTQPAQAWLRVPASPESSLWL
jgi:hypothetical protein